MQRARGLIGGLACAAAAIWIASGIVGAQTRGVTVELVAPSRQFSRTATIVLHEDGTSTEWVSVCCRLVQGRCISGGGKVLDADQRRELGVLVRAARAAPACGDADEPGQIARLHFGAETDVVEWAHDSPTGGPDRPCSDRARLVAAVVELLPGSQCR